MTKPGTGVLIACLAETVRVHEMGRMGLMGPIGQMGYHGLRKRRGYQGSPFRCTMNTLMSHQSHLSHPSYQSQFVNRYRADSRSNRGRFSLRHVRSLFGPLTRPSPPNPCGKRQSERKVPFRTASGERG